MILSSWNVRFGVNVEMAKPWMSKLSSKSHWTFVLMKRQRSWQATLGGPDILGCFFLCCVFLFIFLGTPDSSRRILILGPGMNHTVPLLDSTMALSSFVTLCWANCIPLMFLIANTLPWHFMAWAWKFVISTYTSLVLNECLQLASMRNVYTHWGF